MAERKHAAMVFATGSIETKTTVAHLCGAMLATGTLEPMEVTACQNLGPRERRIRMNTFWIWGAIALVSVVAMRLPWNWRLGLLLPAGVSAFGYFQAQANVCVAFAAANVKVLGDSRKEMIRVTDEAEKAAFKKASRSISLKGVAAAATFTALVMLLP
jgi:hypothetical protein